MTRDRQDSTCVRVLMLRAATRGRAHPSASPLRKSATRRLQVPVRVTCSAALKEEVEAGRLPALAVLCGPSCCADERHADLAAHFIILCLHSSALTNQTLKMASRDDARSHSGHPLPHVYNQTVSKKKNKNVFGAKMAAAFVSA